MSASSLRNVLALFQQQKFEQALVACGKYCSKSKNDPDGLLMLGLIQGALKDYSSAINSLGRAARLKPDLPQIHFNLGVAQWRAGDLDAARASLARAVELNGGFFEARFNLAEVCRELGKWDEALGHYSKAAKLNPAYVPVYLSVGNLLRMRDDYEGAIDNYAKAIELAPNYYEAHISLGQTRFRQERYAEAEAAFDKAVALNPFRAEAYMELGLLAHKRNDLVQARIWLEKSIERDPSRPLAHYNLAMVLSELEEFNDAASAFARAIKLDPRHIDSYMGLASIQRNLGALDLALQTLQNAIVHQPDKAEFYSELGNLMVKLGNPVAALREHRKAVEMAPEKASVHVYLADVLMLHNQYDAALAEFETALSLADDDAAKQSVIAGMAQIYVRRGQHETAYELIKPHLKDVCHPSIALVFGMLADHLGMNERAMELMEACLNEPGIALEHKIDLHFQLGKLCDKLKDYDRAFHCYAAGNRYFAERNSDLITRYRPEDQAAYFDRLRTGTTAEFFMSSPVSGCLSERPVFVVGMPRSGTTLTESILCSHPDVYGAGELTDLSLLRKETEVRTGLAYPESLAKMPIEGLAELAERYLAVLSSKHAGAARVVDKMPHNFLNLGLIALLFPKAKIIHIRRDPIDNCLSIFFQKFIVAHFYASNLEWLGHYYRLYMDLMAHWNRVLPVPILNIRYEDLVTDQEAVTRRMIGFCGLAWDDACLSFHARRRDVVTPSYDQVSRPIYRDSSGRWRNYERHIGPLIESLRTHGVLEEFME